jgi:hypothetical protein
MVTSGLGASAVAAAIALAGVGDGKTASSPEAGVRDDGVPEGPFVNFCPTPEQVESHLKLYGSDYKPTNIACTREGEASVRSSDKPPSGDDELTGKAADEYHDALIESARPAPDGDGDPTTIAGILPDGRAVIIFNSTSDPDKFAGVDIDEYAADQP